MVNTIICGSYNLLLLVSFLLKKPISLNISGLTCSMKIVSFPIATDLPPCRIGTILSQISVRQSKWLFLFLFLTIDSLLGVNRKIFRRVCSLDVKKGFDSVWHYRLWPHSLHLDIGHRLRASSEELLIPNAQSSKVTNDYLPRDQNSETLKLSSSSKWSQCPFLLSKKLSIWRHHQLC